VYPQLDTKAVLTSDPCLKTMPVLVTEFIFVKRRTRNSNCASRSKKCKLGNDFDYVFFTECHAVKN